jgi:hypothetical protein
VPKYEKYKAVKDGILERYFIDDDSYRIAMKRLGLRHEIVGGQLELVTDLHNGVGRCDRASVSTSRNGSTSIKTPVHSQQAATDIQGSIEGAGTSNRRCRGC